MRILLIALTDDPLDPPGDDRYGGGQAFMLDLGRHFVRKNHEIVFLTRKSRIDKPDLQSLGPLCKIYRVSIGPSVEVSHHELWESVTEACNAAKRLVTNEPHFDAVISSNWISGLAASSTDLRPHIHHILSLGRVRLQLGEESHASDQARDAAELEIFGSADRLVCVCRNELLSLRQLYPEVHSPKAVIIPYGVDNRVFQNRPTDPHIYLRWEAERFSQGT